MEKRFFLHKHIRKINAMAAITLATRPLSSAKWNRLLFSQNASSLISRPRYSSTAHPSSRNDQPFRMAVIGSGPAGFYTAYRAMQRIQGAKVDMYEALPVPFGLVRFGVAPDHPEVKNCQEKFEEVASSPNFTFIGNVSVGTPSGHPDGVTVSLSSILRNYNAVVFAYGAAKDRTLNIPGESSLRGIYSAREFVGWYNGLPEHSQLNPDLTQGDTAVIIGQGNVALDVARMLLSRVSTLAKSDIAEHAIDTLSTSRIKHVHIVGRRGPMQAAFTIKEIRELMKLPSVSFTPIDASLIPEDTKSLPRAQRRLMDILLKGSPTQSSDSSSKSWSLDFLLSPKAFNSFPSSPAQLSSTSFETNTLSPSPFSRNAFPLPTGSTQTFPSSIAFRSIGYKSLPLPEFSPLSIPFNDRWGTIAHDGSGRVQHEDRAPDAMMTLSSFPGLYCAGWVKRGPTGVIASTMEDAFSTADAIAEDWDKGRKEFLNGTGKGWEAVKSEIQVDGSRVVDWDDWRRIDRAEKERGREKGKVREKFAGIGEMLEVLR